MRTCVEVEQMLLDGHFVDDACAMIEASLGSTCADILATCLGALSLANVVAKQGLLGYIL